MLRRHSQPSARGGHAPRHPRYASDPCRLGWRCRPDAGARQRGRRAKACERRGAFTLLELVVVLAIVGIVMGLGAPLVSPAGSRLATGQAACRFALVLREAQATAQADRSRVRVRLVDDGHGYCVERVDLPGSPIQARGVFSGSRCSTNYPSGAVDFGSGGWPLAAGSSSPRAGTFVLTRGMSVGSVVLQLGGRIRWR